MRELTDEELMTYPPEDLEIFRNATKDLPTLAGFSGTTYDKYGLKIPYGSGPHIVKHFRTAIEIVHPKMILEIGFNLGYGAAIFLAISEAKVVSTDISDKDETIAAAGILENRHPQFKYIPRGLLHALSGNKFDLVFIDGGHEEKDVVEDIQLAKDWGIEFLLMDDCYPRFGPGVMPAINNFNLQVVKDMDNLKLVTWPKD